MWDCFGQKNDGVDDEKTRAHVALCAEVGKIKLENADLRAALAREDANNAGQMTFWKIVFDPPQYRLECNETNKYSWVGAMPADESQCYTITWDILDKRGLSRKLMDVMRAEHHQHFTLFVGGNIPLNYYLTTKFGAPKIPSNDIDIKIDIGNYMRKLIEERAPGEPSASSRPKWETWSTRSNDPETAVLKECFDEALAEFVVHAKALMEELQKVAEAALPLIEQEMLPLGIKVGPRGALVFHKTHAASGLHLVPLSGGVFQLMVELVHSSGDAFMWNVIDLECDWSSALPACHPKGVAKPVELVTDPSLPEFGLRMLEMAALREDLIPKYQECKEGRRAMKRSYWDWAVSKKQGSSGTSVS
jgi:hypothetical protein